jgi:hypothetical protein
MTSADEREPHVSMHQGAAGVLFLLLSLRKVSGDCFSRYTRQQMIVKFALAIHMSYTYLCVGYLEDSILGYCTHYYHICLQE